MKPSLQKIIVLPICLIFLIGTIFTGNSSVLCFGDTGQIKFEIACLPGCGEIEQPDESAGSCELDEVPHSGCSGCSDDCSDVEYNNSLWSKRVQNNHIKLLANNYNLALDADFPISKISFGNSNPQITKFHLAYGQSPPASVISTAVLRC